MADTLPEHKEGGDDGKPSTVVPLREESSGLQCASSGICSGDPHPKEASTLLHSSALQQGECGSVSLHPAEAKGAKSSEEAADNPGRLVVKDGSEAAEAFKKQDDEISLGFDESKLAKTSVSQAKDPPERENSQAERKMLVTEKNESPPLEGASSEIQSVSTKSSETPEALNDNSSGHPQPCAPALAETVLTGDVLKKPGIPTGIGTSSAVGCQESLMSSPKPTSPSTKKSPDLGLESSSSVSRDPHQERSVETLAESQGPSKNSIGLASLEAAGIEVSSTRLSTISSATDLCSASQLEHSVVDSPSQSSLATSGSESSSTPTQTSSVQQQESGNKMALLVSQSQAKESESHPQTSRAQCPQEYLSPDHKSQDKVSVEQDGVVIIGEKNHIGNKVPGTPENVTGQSEKQMEQNESWSDVSLASDTETEALPLIVATHSLSQEQDAGKESTEKGEITALVSTEMEATKKKVVMPLESEPLKPVTIGSSLQPLEEIQEASSVMEDSSFSADVAIIDSSADEADSIGGLVINNVIGAADGVVDFQPDEVETEKELTDISASAPQLGESNDSSDELGPSAKRRRLENGPNGVEDKSNSAKKVILKVIPVKNGHGVWDSQKLQEVLLTKGTILLQIHASKESMELFALDKDDRKIDFTAIMAETKDVDHDHMLSFANVEPEGDDPLAVAASHPDTSSLPSFGRPFPHPHPRSRSTALQPAMSRPGFKHLQTPQLYHMKNQVLGLPPPPCLEFEEPQMGAPDWSGFGLKSKSTRRRKPQLPYVTIPSQLQRVNQSGQSTGVTQVCKVCGVTLASVADFEKHKNCVVLNCEQCQFQANTLESYALHVKLHQLKHAQHKCYICDEVFGSPITHAVHKRKIHGLYECRYCSGAFSSKTEWSNHIKLNHKAESKKNTSTAKSSSEDPSFSKKLMVPNVKMLVASPPAGTIISSSLSGSINSTTTCNTDMQLSSAVYNPQLYSHGNPTRKLPLVDEARITCKDEPLETENNTPQTILVKINPKRRWRNRGPRKSNSLPCESCTAVFKNLTQLRIHVKQKHTVRPKCPACNLTRSSSRKVFQHQITAHKEKLRCRHYCLSLFDTREELSAHHISVHNKDDTVMKCRYCRMNYTKGTYEEHLQECPGDIKCKRVKVCPTCDRKFVDPTELSNHVKICESTVKFDCERESSAASTSAEIKPTMQDQVKNESNASQLETHKVLEGVEKSSGESDILKSEILSSSQCKTARFKCRFCPTYFSCKESGVDHMINHHKTVFSYMKEYKICDICGKLFISGLSLCKHLASHYEKSAMWHKLLPANLSMDDIKGKCWICKTSGISYNPFHINTRNSFIETLLSSEAFKTSVIDISSSFHCCLCAETFSDTHRYWSHIKIHLSKSPLGNIERCQQFSCPRCPQKYSVKSHLLEHLAVHLIQLSIHGDRKEQLESNNTLADTDDKDLSKEELQGESDGTKPESGVSVGGIGIFKCLQCEQTFSVKNDALKHLRSSHGKELKEMVSGKACHLCDQSFAKPLALCCHILNHYIELGMWEDLVPRNLLSKVDKNYCWICNSILKAQASRHVNKRNCAIEKSLLSSHEELEEDELFQCPLCEFSCSNRYGHWKHIKLHLFLGGNSPGKTDEDSEAEQSAISQDSENKTFECFKCNTQFSEMSDFHKHIATHFLTPCKTRKRKNNEDVHDKLMAKKRKTMTLRSKSLRRGHSGHGNIRCIDCSVTFKKYDDAVSHVLSVHKFKITNVKELDLSCKMCGANFKGEWWLCKHIVNHYNNLEMWDALVPRDLVNSLNTRNQCWICNCVLDKNYAAHISKRNAYIGMLLASNCKEKESRFDCSLCNQEFPTRNEYWQHIKLHMCKPPSGYIALSKPMPKDKKKDYECSDCSLNFQNEAELYKHLASHFLEYTDGEKSGKGILLDELLSEDTMQTGESSEDEWMPSSIVKKMMTESLKEEDDNESNDYEDKGEGNKDGAHNSEPACHISTTIIEDIKTEDTDSSNTNKM